MDRKTREKKLEKKRVRKREKTIEGNVTSK